MYKRRRVQVAAAYWQVAILLSHSNQSLFFSPGCLQRLSLSNSVRSQLNSPDVTPTSSSSTGTKSRSSYTDLTSSAASSEKTYALKGTKLIVFFNFEGQAFDDLSVHPGEYVFANLKDQIVPGMIWAYSPHRRKSGFIPEDHVKEPIVTDIWRIHFSASLQNSSSHWMPEAIFLWFFKTCFGGFPCLGKGLD